MGNAEEAARLLVVAWLASCVWLAVACEEPSPPSAQAGAGDRAAGAPGLAGEGGSEPEGQGGEAGASGTAPRCAVTSCDGADCETLLGDARRCSSAIRLIGPESLENGWATRVVTGDTSCAVPVSASAECALRGPALAFELDLEDAPSPVDLRVEVEAGFDASLRLEQGACLDTIMLACNEDHVPGVERAVLTQRLEPGRYRLVVGGERVDEAGEFRLIVSVREPDARCLTSPPNDTCEGALELDPTLPVQSVIGSTRCAHNDAFSFFECHLEDSSPDVFYRLDLRERTTPVVLYASTDLPPTDFDTSLYVMDSAQGHCFAPIDCNDDGPSDTRILAGSSELVTRLEPGEYFLVVDGAEGAGDFGLRVSLDELECTTSDSCEGAVELDPSSGVRSVTVDLACAKASRGTQCSRWQTSPDAFFRLDLSGHGGPVRVLAESSEGSSFSIALLAVSEQGGCGTELHCGGRVDWVLEPEVYYLLVSVDIDTPHRTELTLAIEPVAPPDLKLCIDADVAQCAEHSYQCCSESARGCLYSYSTCGLDPRLHDCVCATAPECCDMNGIAADCTPVLLACGLFCADFDYGAFCAEQNQ